MNDVLTRLAKELPELIEAGRDELEHGTLKEESIQFKRGQLAAFRQILEIIKPPKRELIGEPPAYGLSVGTPGY